MNTQPPTPTTKAELIDLIRRDRQQLAQLIARVPSDQITQPGAENDWSIKDTMAHITDWEQYLVRRIDAALHGTSIEQRHMPDDAAMDQINDANIERNRQRSVEEIRQAFAQSGDQVIAVIEQLSDDDLWGTTSISAPFREPLWQHVAGETYEHYAEHRDAIEAWLRTRGLI